MNRQQYKERLALLDEHIANIERATSQLADLKGDTDAFERYLGGPRQARAVMMRGNAAFDAEETPKG